jgi:hypothetical protein
VGERDVHSSLPDELRRLLDDQSRQESSPNSPHHDPPTVTISYPTDDASETSLRSTQSLRNVNTRRRVHSLTPDPTGESLSYDLGYTGAHLQGDDFNGEEIIANLQRQFERCQIEWPKGRNTYFIPADDIRRLVTEGSILNELRCSNLDLPEALLREEARSACQSAYKLFAILVCANKSSSFHSFLKEGLCDDDLPFLQSSDFTDTHEVLSSKTRKPIQAMRKWGTYQVRHFCSDQYQMLAPIFKQRSNVEHQDLRDNHVLPIIKELLEPIGSGGYGLVRAVKMHPAHQFVHRDTNPGVGR